MREEPRGVCVKPKSAIQKGKAFMKHVVELLRHRAPHLGENEIRIGAPGVKSHDIWMTDKACEYYPFTIECKWQESLNIWACLDQAEAQNKRADRSAVLFFKRSRSDVYVAMKANEFLNLIETTWNQSQKGDSHGQEESKKAKEDN